MSIYIENPGLLTTVQDGGRFGYQKYGISPAGPMDRRSFEMANILAGNDRNAAGLEITYMGPSIRFEEANVIAITGGDLRPQLNGKDLPMYQAYPVCSGSVLTFRGMNGGGCRGYIAFAGGLNVEPVMGSCSTLMKNSLGGIEGRKLKAGDRIPFTKPVMYYPNMEERKVLPETFGGPYVYLRVIPGPQDTEFSTQELQKFFWYDAEITNEFDRMGCRLHLDQPLQGLHDGNIISDGIAFGSIQVPADGQPIVMMADRQGVGGYPKIGTVISADLPSLAQAVPGTKVRFVRMDIQTAQAVYRREEKKLRAIDTELNGTRY